MSTLHHEFLVRPVEESDIPYLWPIVEDNADSEKNFIQRVSWKRTLPDHYIPVAVVRGRAVGYAWVHDYGPHIRVGHRTARLNDLFVAEEWRRCGAGRRLFEEVRGWCERRGVRWLQWQSSQDAVGFYERLGLKGDSCPDPEHPFFEIEFRTP